MFYNGTFSERHATPALFCQNSLAKSKSYLIIIKQQNFLNISDETNGLELDSDSRLAYLSLKDVPGIHEVNIETGQRRMIFDTENILYIRMSPDKR